MFGEMRGQTWRLCSKPSPDKLDAAWAQLRQQKGRANSRGARPQSRDNDARPRSLETADQPRSWGSGWSGRGSHWQGANWSQQHWQGRDEDDTRCPGFGQDRDVSHFLPEYHPESLTGGIEGPTPAGPPLPDRFSTGEPPVTVEQPPARVGGNGGNWPPIEATRTVQLVDRRIPSTPPHCCEGCLCIAGRFIHHCCAGQKTCCQLNGHLGGHYCKDCIAGHNPGIRGEFSESEDDDDSP